jgi:hypothetical protein
MKIQNQRDLRLISRVAMRFPRYFIRKQKKTYFSKKTGEKMIKKNSTATSPHSSHNYFFYLKSHY